MKKFHVWVFMSDLTTKDDLEHLETVCRAIVGEDD